MKRVLLISTVILLMFGVGSAVAGGPSINNPDMVGGEEYTLEYQLDSGESIQNVVGDGAVNVQDYSESDGVVTVIVMTDPVEEQTEGSIFLQTSGGEQRTDINVYPSSTSAPSSGEVEGMEEFEDMWIDMRVNEVQTDRGIMTVYEQRDPTRGPIDEETGVPRGEWVEVPIDEEGNPQWLFTNPNEFAVYTATQANTRYGERTRIYLTAAAIVLISLAVQWIGIPFYRKRKEMEFWYGNGDESGGGLL